MLLASSNFAFFIELRTPALSVPIPAELLAPLLVVESFPPYKSISAGEDIDILNIPPSHERSSVPTYTKRTVPLILIFIPAPA